MSLSSSPPLVISPSITKLSAKETADLEKAERTIHDEVAAIIARHLDTQTKNFASVKIIGESLEKIRKNVWWRQKGNTWDDYCRREFGFSRDRASQIIRSWEMGEDLQIEFLEVVKEDVNLGELNYLKDEFGQAGLPMPNERALRALLYLPKDRRLQIYLSTLKAIGATASLPRRVTAAKISEVAETILSDDGNLYQDAIISGYDSLYEIKQDRLLSRMKEIFDELDKKRKNMAIDFVLGNTP